MATVASNLALPRNPANERYCLLCSLYVSGRWDLTSPYPDIPLGATPAAQIPKSVHAVTSPSIDPDTPCTVAEVAESVSTGRHDVCDSTILAAPSVHETFGPNLENLDSSRTSRHPSFPVADAFENLECGICHGLFFEGFSSVDKLLLPIREAVAGKNYEDVEQFSVSISLFPFGRAESAVNSSCKKSQESSSACLPGHKTVEDLTTTTTGQHAYAQCVPAVVLQKDRNIKVLLRRLIKWHLEAEFCRNRSQNAFGADGTLHVLVEILSVQHALCTSCDTYTLTKTSVPNDTQQVDVLPAQHTEGNVKVNCEAEVVLQDKKRRRLSSYSDSQQGCVFASNGVTLSQENVAINAKSESDTCTSSTADTHCDVTHEPKVSQDGNSSEMKSQTVARGRSHKWRPWRDKKGRKGPQRDNDRQPTVSWRCSQCAFSIQADSNNTISDVYRPIIGKVVVERGSKLYVEGRYLKWSREMTQTRLIIDGETVTRYSVEDFIGKPLAKLFGASKWNFYAAGREDIDVRMLGSGRPFIVELTDAKRLSINDCKADHDSETEPHLDGNDRDAVRSSDIIDIPSILNDSQATTSNRMSGEVLDECSRREVSSSTSSRGTWKLSDIENYLNYASAGRVGVCKLSVASKCRSTAYHSIQSMAEQKKKKYGCLVWVEREVSQEELDGVLSATPPLTLGQKTPIRVLHRRANACRPKIIYSLKAKRLSCHYFILVVESEAGCYIKEFVHGDLGRTVPNVGSILGGTKALLLQLDVLDIVDAHLGSREAILAA